MRRLLSFLFVVAMAVALPSAWASAASTVGTNVSTDGTLSATGLSTLTGGYISGASSTVSADLNVAGDLLATSTLQVTGLGTFYGGFQATASSSVGAALTVTGQVNASSTLLVLGLATQYGGFQSNASSSVGAALTVTGQTIVSSTFLVRDLATLYGGFQSNASSSVGGRLLVTDQFQASSTLLASGLATLYSGFQSNASSSVGSGLNISGSLSASSSLRIGSDGDDIVRFFVDGSNGNITSSGTLRLMDSSASSTILSPTIFALGVSSTLGFASGTFFIDATGAGNGAVYTSGSVQVGANVLHRQNNAGDIGAFGTAFRDVYVSSSLTIGGGLSVGGINASSTAIRAHISQITGAINLAAAASTTACTTSSVIVVGAQVGDTSSAAPTVADDAFMAGSLNTYINAANTVVLKWCSQATFNDDQDPASMAYRIDVWKH